MDEPLVLISKMDELVLLAATDDALDKAAIYGAVKAIQNEFINSKLSTSHQLIDTIKAACFYLNAAIGYEFTAQLSKAQCIELAKEKLVLVRSIINVQFS